MIDIETFSTAPNAVVSTIGFVKFNPYSTEIYDKLYIRINVDDQTAIGRDISDSTIEWWGNQSPEAQEEVFSENDRTSLADFIAVFPGYIKSSSKIWSQGALDFVILENMFKQQGIPTPWAFWNVMDSRTIFNTFGDPRKYDKTAHNALNDCLIQVRALQEVFAKHNITEGMK